MKPLLLAAALALAGCASPMIANDLQYVVNGNTAMKSASQAAADADAHCARYGKRAVLRDFSYPVYTFDCV